MLFLKKTKKKLSQPLNITFYLEKELPTCNDEDGLWFDLMVFVIYFVY